MIRRTLAKRPIQRLAREVIVLSSARHPNILELLGFHLDLASKTAWIISPWAAHGDAFSYLQKAEVETDLKEKLNLVRNHKTDALFGLDIYHHSWKMLLKA